MIADERDGGAEEGEYGAITRYRKQGDTNRR